MDWIMKYWVEWAFGLLAGCFVFVWRWVVKRFKEQKAEENAIKEGVKAILHDRIYQAHGHFMKKGYCTLEDKRNMEYMYKPYEKLGGNGTGEQAYKDILKLPTEGEKRE